MQLSYLEEKERKRKERVSPDELKRQKLTELRAQEVAIDERIVAVTAEKQSCRKEIEDLEAELAPRGYREFDRSVEQFRSIEGIKRVDLSTASETEEVPAQAEVAQADGSDLLARTRTAGPG